MDSIFTNLSKRKAPTKIVATLGPASADEKMIMALIERGVDMFRINFSHGKHSEHEKALANIRSAERKLGIPIAAMADLCGPKIRVGDVKGPGMQLEEGQKLIVLKEDVLGENGRVSTIYPLVVEMARVGERILLDDGKMRIRVVSKTEKDLVCNVEVGGLLKSHKGMNLPDTDLGSSSITEKDKKDVAFIVKHNFDYVALSFVSNAESVTELRALLDSYNCSARIVSKVEKPSALDNIEAIIEVSDAVMVARGDLGVEMNLFSVPPAQKLITDLCHKKFKPCIIATQMLETMIENPVPTRAEVSDVANAVLDHADAVMLSGETAIGKYPLAVVSLIDKITVSIKDVHDKILATAPRPIIEDSTLALSMALAVRGAIKFQKVVAIAVYTVSGATARYFSKMRFPCPIIGITNSIEVARKINLYFGVTPHLYVGQPLHTREVVTEASKIVQTLGYGNKGEKIVVISSRPLYMKDSANTLVLHEIGNEQ